MSWLYVLFLFPVVLVSAVLMNDWLQMRLLRLERKNIAQQRRHARNANSSAA